MPDAYSEKKKEQTENVINTSENKNKVHSLIDFFEMNKGQIFDDSSSDSGSIDNMIPMVQGKKIKKPVPPEETLPEPEFIGIEAKFAVQRQDDGDRMKKVRDALRNYHAIKDDNLGAIAALDMLMKACDDYCFLRFSLLKSDRGKQRLQEVKALKEQAKTEKFKVIAKNSAGDESAIHQGVWRMKNKEDLLFLGDEIRKKIRKKNRETNIDREALRNKKTYKLKPLTEKQQENNSRYIAGSQEIKSIKNAIKEVMPGVYDNVDKSLTDKEAEELEMELIHSEGLKFLNMGHDVIEFDVAGSTFDDFRKEYEGIHGQKLRDKNQAAIIHGEKLDDKGYFWKDERKKATKERIAKKTRYSIAGPGMLNMGPFSDYSIQGTRKRIRDTGISHLKPVFDAWRELERSGRKPKYHNIDFMFRGHSRGGVGASHGAMMLKYWVQENYPEYIRYLSFNLIQYDPVPGGDVEFSLKDDMERFDVKEYQGVNKGSFTINGEKMAPLGSNAGTTVVYSMVNQADKIHENFFSPQEVLHAKRIILTPFTHDVGLDIMHMDNTQMKGDKKEKEHSMAFINASNNKVYRSSGLNELDPGVYVMDENHVMVKIDSLSQLKNILMRSMPDSYVKRRQRILNAAASVFGDKSQMDEYAPIDHERNHCLMKAIEQDGSAGDLRAKVQTDLRSLRTLLNKKPAVKSIDLVSGAYRAAIESCSRYIEDQDKGKVTSKGRLRLDQIKEMYSALIREKRHFEEKARERSGKAGNFSSIKSWNELFMEPVLIKREECDVKTVRDPAMKNAYRVEHGKSVSFFTKMSREKARSAAAMSRMTEHAGFTGLYRAAVEAKVDSDQDNRIMSGIVYEQTYDLSYAEVMSKDFEYSKNGDVLMEKGAKEKLNRIFAFDLLFGITDRLKGNYSSVRVSLQRHQDKKTGTKVRSGAISDIRDTYSINDVCADLIMSPLFSGRLSKKLNDFDVNAIRSLSKESKNMLKKLTPAELKEMAGSSITIPEMNILSARLNAIKTRI